MVPDCQRRLEAAYSDLKTAIVSRDFRLSVYIAHCMYIPCETFLFLQLLQDDCAEFKDTAEYKAATEQLAAVTL